MEMFNSNDNSRTILIYNKDFHQQDSITFAECLSMKVEEIYNIFCTKRYRGNTGTYLMTDTLAKLLDAKWVYPYDFDSMNESSIKSIVTNAFHCMSPRFVFDREYWQKVLDLGVKIVPMTCGFRYHEEDSFFLTKDMIYILKQISERNEIGVRGERAATILESYGIKNIRIVGCHSLFYHNNRNFQIEKRDRYEIHRLNFNFNQCYADFFQSHVDFCNTSANLFNYVLEVFERKIIDIKYSLQTSFMKEWMGYNNFSNWERVREFVTNCGTYYFSVDDWIYGIRDCDFSIGTQFHGTIAALQAGIPSLIFAIDDRVRELCKVHYIPCIDIKKFDKSKPIIEYYKETDYEKFNREYSKLYDNFCDYCKVNDVDLR
ncbi:MAG: polysaccharide pyruvyl transferase family protein [Acetatifactor sp.]